MFWSVLIHFALPSLWRLSRLISEPLLVLSCCSLEPSDLAILNVSLLHGKINYIINPKTPHFSHIAAVAELLSTGVTSCQQFPPLLLATAWHCMYRQGQEAVPWGCQVLRDLLPEAQEIILRCCLCPPPYHHPHFCFIFLFYHVSIPLLPMSRPSEQILLWRAVCCYK